MRKIKIKLKKSAAVYLLYIKNTYVLTLGHYSKAGQPFIDLYPETRFRLLGKEQD